MSKVVSALVKARRALALSALSFLVFCAGCWDMAELTDRGYVLGVALDVTDDDRIQLTAQFYKPVPNLEGTQKDKTYVNITTKSESLFEAVRDIPIQLGRRPQWSHMRVILLSEEFINRRGVLVPLDFFFRDHETRLTSVMLVTEGEAGKYLKTDPLLENTVSQQYRETQMTTAEMSGKSAGVNFWQLVIQLRGETGIVVVPYLQVSNVGENNPATEGAVVLNEEGVLAKLSPKETESLLFLRNRYKNGVINVPCPSSAGRKEGGKDVFEVVRSTTRMHVNAAEEKISIHFQVDVKGAIGELQCSNVIDSKSEREFAKRTEKLLEEAFLKTVEKLQRHQADAIAAGNHVYAKNPRLWKKLKDNWGERFAEAEVEVDVSVYVYSTGMISGRAMSQPRRS